MSTHFVEETVNASSSKRVEQVQAKLCKVRRLAVAAVVEKRERIDVAKGRNALNSPPRDGKPSLSPR
jgi:flagellar biosynthesis/type III secretory pathway M-ring protein FliF/YscJ